MAKSSRTPRNRPCYDAGGRFVGYRRAPGALEPRSDAASQAAVGKAAIFDDAGRSGRITDVIFELDTGEVLAYQFVDEGGAAFYLPARALRHETDSELHFPATAIALASPDLVALGERLAGGPPAEDPDEFTIVEELPDQTRPGRKN